ncbi:MAG: hypothetical protein PVF17_10070, partial [Ignavibacteria bacterium]
MFELYKPQRLVVFATILLSFLLLTTQKTFSQNALQFDGSNDYVTFGSPVGPNGVLINSPTWDTETGIAPPPTNNYSLQFDGTNQYVTFGVAQGLNSKNFTVETWFKRTGPGVSNITGGSGISDMIPLISKGAPEAEGRYYNANYILGIQASTNLLAADFEEGFGSTQIGLNHPLYGVTSITTGVWYHVALTFDYNESTGAATLTLYLNGIYENSLSLTNRYPDFESIQHASLATMIETNGTPHGYFDGILDEARIWNYARTQGEISGSMNSEIKSASGLLGRWGLNEGFGNGVNNTSTATPNLGFSIFTLETWFKKTGTGTPASTGTGGISAIPLITKGRGEADGDNRDMNYFLGIRASDNVIAADFEDVASGLNHPVAGTTIIANDVWYHVAATYDGATWKLYLNGNLEATLTANATPRLDGIQHAGLGTAMTSVGATSGHFEGIMDEIRIWNYARTQGEISGSMNSEIESAAGLIGRWGLNEGSGTTAVNSVVYAPVVDGTLHNGGSVGNGPQWVTGLSFPIELSALLFDGSNDYVTFGAATNTLGAQSFTLECWFKRTGTGLVTTTGGTGSTGGIKAIPLITKGRGQADGTTEDANYFLGINAPTSGYPFAANVLVADFEEGTGTTDPGRNHPVGGVTPIVNNVWYHAAVTYDAPNRRWRLYLNGVLEKDTVIEAGTRFPQYLSVQHAGLGTAMNSGGTADGFFAGVMDEPRIWNVARTQQQIQDNINLELTSGTGLIGRWGLNDGSGIIATNSVVYAPVVDGTLTNGPLWTFGAPFDIAFTAPEAPTALTVTINTAEIVRLSWTDNSSDETSFDIERSTAGSSGPFTNIGNVTADVTTYTDNTVSELTDYWYRIIAKNDWGNSDPSNVVNTTTPAAVNNALQFDGTNDYVTFGPAVGITTGLGVTTFTLECWFKKTGDGLTASSGSGGIDAIPLITKGRGEADGDNRDMNYFLGIRGSDNVIAVDFEDMASGGNHPANGTTAI